jgi:hypothetical protein
MSPRASNLLFVLAALLFVGAGVFVLAKRRLAAEIAAAHANRDEELARVRAENRGLKERLSAVPAGTAPAVEAARAAPVVEPIARARIAAGLIRSGLLGRFAWPNPHRNSLTAGMQDVAEFLGLTVTEATALQQAAETGKQEFTKALLASASAVRDGTMVTITLKESPDVRAAYTGMLQSIAAVLGPERYELFESLGARDATEKLFNRWGLEPVTLMISHSTTIPDAFFPQRTDSQGNPVPVRSGPRGDPSGRLLYHFTQVKPGQSGVGGASGTDTLENLGINIGPVVTLVPTDL